MLQQTRTVHRILFAVLMAASVALLAQTAVAQQYQVSYLDSIGGTRSRGNSINNRGWIAGFSFVTGDLRRHATLWREGSVLDLGTLGDPDRNSNVAWPVKNNRGIIGLGNSGDDSSIVLHRPRYIAVSVRVAERPEVEHRSFSPESRVPSQIPGHE